MRGGLQRAAGQPSLRAIASVFSTLGDSMKIAELEQKLREIDE
jgi:hypothetical protein